MSTTSTQTMTEAVLAAVAEHKGVDERALDPPLYEVIRPEALNRLFADTTGQVTFEYLDTVVTVDADRNVSVEPLAVPHP